MPTAVRPALSRVLLAATGLALRGRAVACPCCGGRYRRFLAYPTRLCPGCGAYERHRALALLLEAAPHVLPPGGRLLHVGPERALHERLRSRADAYIAIDLDHPLATYRMDVRELALRDGSFDRVVCLHVLGDVRGHDRALRELHRVTEPGGRALFQEPGPRTPALGRDLAAAGWHVQPLRTGDLFASFTVARHGLDADEVFYACERPA